MKHTNAGNWVVNEWKQKFSLDFKSSEAASVGTESGGRQSEMSQTGGGKRTEADQTAAAQAQMQAKWNRVVWLKTLDDITQVLSQTSALW